MSVLIPMTINFLLGTYGRHINVWDWTTHKLIQRVDLGESGYTPLEIRFLHDPDATEGFVGCALTSAIFRFFRTPVRMGTSLKIGSLNFNQHSVIKYKDFI